MKDKVCIVTGSNSGIGKETALGLAKMGAWVIMVVRNPERGEKARFEILSQSGSNTVDLRVLGIFRRSQGRNGQMLRKNA